MMTSVMQRALDVAMPWRDRGAADAVAIYLSRSMVGTALGEFGVDGGMHVNVIAEPMPQLADLRDQLGKQVKTLGLGRHDGCKHVNLVLAPELYKLCLVDKPDVPEADVAEAVRWQLQEQVDYPVDQACLSTFPLPDSASRNRPMIFAAIAQTEFLRNIVHQVLAAGLALDSIDIAELALRNLAWHCFPEPDQSVAVLRLTANAGVVNISRGDELYLARRISGVPQTFTEDMWGDFQERLVLQVQRSIDYYESAMNQPPCNMLMVACTEDWTERVTDHLETVMPVPVRTVTEALEGDVTLTLHNPDKQTVDWRNPTPRQVNALAAAMPALGGVLRNRITVAEEAA